MRAVLDWVLPCGHALVIKVTSSSSLYHQLNMPEQGPERHVSCPALPSQSQWSANSLAMLLQKACR